MKSWNGLDDAAAPVQPRRTQVRWRALSATFVTLVCLAAVDTIFPGLKTWDVSSALRKKPVSAHTAFQWDEISPSEHLHFHKCFDGFECAKLKLPLDYFSGTYPNHTVSVAITKAPAIVPVNDPRYGGPVLINPGGPGGPGAAVALAIGTSLRSIVDSDESPSIASADPRYFDVIGFDPRGIGWTKPGARCMPDQPSAWSWNLREDNEGLLGSSDAALGRLWSMTHAFGESCRLAEEDQDGPDIKQYMSTAFVARDMLEITERHAEYVAKEVAQIAAQKAGKRPGCCKSTYIPGESKLHYWGFSYGTYLGSTFASMFPDRVGRLVLDGVVSSYDYNHSLGNGSLTDSEKALKSFYTYCYNLGPEECPLATANSSVADIEERSLKIIESLYHNPLPLVSSDGPDFLTWSDMKILIFGSVYQPQFAFQVIAWVLAAIEAGGGNAMDQLAQIYHYRHIYSCPVDPSAESEYQVSSIVATISILCGDGIDQSHLSKDEFAEYWDLLDAVSPMFGSYWSMLLMRCTAWKIGASHRYEGRFGANTSNPILFLSNTADPVTPLRSGRYMHSLFPGSGLLVSDHAGHCTLSGVDDCILERVKAYFQTGEMPPPGTVCVPPPSPFSLNSTDPDSPFYDPSLGSANVVTLHTDGMDCKQRRLHDAGLKLQRAVAESGILSMNMPGSEKAKRVMHAAVNNQW
ncbi:alpha beta hydrolase fold-1 [Stemphylium lycopersici]|nr:alpha beta hydrolase fold-1 [Stemphylium lycopersici]RAR10130.1 alpha beta hydrolase fold-1 [Stemphylium lycopersici]